MVASMVDVLLSSVIHEYNARYISAPCLSVCHSDVTCHRSVLHTLALCQNGWTSTYHCERQTDRRGEL